MGTAECYPRSIDRHALTSEGEIAEIGKYVHATIPVVIGPAKITAVEDTLVVTAIP